VSADPTSGSTLPLDGAAGEAPALEERIGPYRILRPLGEGGMGVVHLAEQDEPIRRQVAIKVIKLGMDSRQVVSRFESERHLLALMDHPGIARVLDAGTTVGGRPFFVMEYVAGPTLTAYCDDRLLDNRARLSLFRQVCAAVQHAHQKGVIHRDLKPGNVLVAEMDGRPHPKVIDFGVAKATRGDLPDLTLMTQHGLVVGTPEYMSPEQAEMTGTDVDTTTDIYSLGVVLYELLSGALPFDPSELRRAGLTGIQRILRDTDPPAPSAKVVTLGGVAASVADKRRTDVGTLRRELAGELDWIVLKAMEKERSRRYASVSELSADVERYLAGEPVLARPASAAYRIRKFAARHRAGVAAAALVVVSLVGGLAASGLALVRARRAEAEAVRQSELARKEAAKAQAVNAFLQDMLGSANPREGGREVKVVDILGKALDGVPSAYAGQPELEAAVRDTVGVTYQNLGELKRAEEQIRAALELRRRTLGPDHPDTLSSAQHLVSQLYIEGRYAEGEPLARQVAADLKRIRGPEDPETLSTIHDHALLLFEVDRRDEALALMKEMVETRKRVFGPEHRRTLLSMSTLVAKYMRLDRDAEAEPLVREVLAAQERTLGPDHSNTIYPRKNLGGILHQQKRLDEAETVLRRVLDDSRRVAGPRNFETLVAANDLAAVLIDRHAFGDAEALLRETIAGANETLTPSHWFTGVFRRNLGRCLFKEGRRAEAERELLAAYAALAAARGAEDGQTVIAVRDLVDLYDAWGRPADVRTWRAKLPAPSPAASAPPAKSG
jgi:non-specific serine/threonine protein kinase/serine/threonine-protein kinase